jgi:hypothetical protein
VRERAIVFFTLLAAYAWFFGGSGFNQNSTFALTRALVERHQINIDPYAGNTADVSFHGGRTYSNKGPGLAVLATVPYAAMYAIHGAPANPLTLNVYLYICTVVVCGISGAVLGLLIFLAASKRGANVIQALGIAFITGLGTPLFSYSTMLFPHVPAAMLIFLAYLALDGTLPRRPLVSGAAAGAATCVFYLVAPLAVMLPFVARDRRDALKVIAGGLPFALALALYQSAAFGSPFRTSIATENPAFHEPGAVLGILHFPQLDALWGLTFSPYRGLFFLAPILLIAIAGVRDRFTIIGFAILLLANASFFGWHGGYAIGPRYLLHIVPFVALGLLRTAARVRLLRTALATVSLLFNFAVTAVDPQPPDSLTDPVLKYALPSLITGRAAFDERAPWLYDYYTGHTSTNRVAADEMLPFKKHPPGSPESEWASFNLGELLFGAGSLLSIVPIVVAISLASTLGLRRARRTTPDTQTERSHSA